MADRSEDNVIWGYDFAAKQRTHVSPEFIDAYIRLMPELVAIARMSDDELVQYDPPSDDCT